MIVGRIGRTSIRNADSTVARSHPRAGAHALEHCELACRADRREPHLACRTAAPCRADSATEFLQADDLLSRRRVFLPQLGKGACPQLGQVATQVVPAAAGQERERTVEDQRPRSLRSFCREHDGLRAALAHAEEHGLSESDGVHDGLDLGRSIIQRANFRDRVRQPDPSLVEQEDATERGELLEERLELRHGPEQLDVADHRPNEDELDGPVAEYLIREAKIAAAGVRRFRHGVSVPLSSITTSDFCRSCVPLAPIALSA